MKTLLKKSITFVFLFCTISFCTCIYATPAISLNLQSIEKASSSFPAPSNFKVDSVSLLATWNVPVFNILSEDFESAVFPPAEWSNNTQGLGWFKSTNGSSAFFTIPAHSQYACINDDANNQNECCSYLMTKELDLTEYDGYYLSFESYFPGSWGETASLEYSLDEGISWHFLQSVEKSAGWIKLSVDLSNLSGIDGENSIRIGFHFNDNGSWTGGWAIDNVKVESKTPPQSGYNLYVNGEYYGNSSDTSFSLNPDNINFCEDYIAEVEAQYSTGYSERTSKHFTSAFLYPPGNFDAYFNDWIILMWDSPENGKKSSNLMQADLIGYKLYRNNTLIAELDTNQRWYVDPLIWPAHLLYSIVAKYDASSTDCADNQGFAYSISSCALVSISGGPILPFIEDWTTGQFDINQWSADQNWIIDGVVGNMAPSAKFKNEPVLTNYSKSLTSYFINAKTIQTETPYSLYFDFDIRLDDSLMNGLEKMDIDILLESDTVLLYSFQNSGDLNWTRLHLDISDFAKDTVFRIRCTANGQNTESINGWWIDNIHIYGTYYLYPAVNLTAKRTGSPENQIQLNWQKPTEFDIIPGTWHNYDDGTNASAYGQDAPLVFSVAMKLNSTDLSSYVGQVIKKIKFFPDEALCNYTLRIWSDSGIVYEQAINDPEIGNWNEILLDSPFIIDSLQNYYVGFHCVTQTGSPAGIDNGPALPGKGDLITFDNGKHWRSLLSDEGIDANWNLSAFIEELEDSLYPVLGYQIYRKDFESHPGGVDPEIADSTEYVYLGNVSAVTFSYLDTDLSNSGNNCYDYYVKANYPEGLSAHSNFAWDCIYVSNNPVEENTLKIYPNPASSVISIESVSGIKQIRIYNSSGSKIADFNLSGEKKTSFNVANYASGMYNLSVITNKNEILQRKFIIK